MKRMISRVLVLLMTVTLFGGMALWSGAASGRPDHVIINQVYGGGTAGDGAVSHSFVELYNPTGNTVSLAGWSLQVQNGITNLGTVNQTPASEWAVYAFPSGAEIAPHTSYLIRFALTSPAARYVIPQADADWTDADPLSNRAFSVALVDSQNQLSKEITAAQKAGVVDLLGALNTIGDDLPLNYEGDDPFSKISKQQAARRVDFMDTGHNLADFESIDYRTSGIDGARLAEVKPRWSGDGAWGQDIMPNPLDHVIINQVYGSGPLDNTGAVSHSFIELYNPTDEPVNLAGWSLQLQNGNENSGTPATGWERLNFNSEHVIGPHGFYLIRLAQAAPKALCQIVRADIDWAGGRVLSNRAFSVALVGNTTLLSQSITSAQIKNVVDLIGALNDPKTADMPRNYEGAPLSGISKQKSARRINFRDTGNNAADFETLDWRSTGIGAAERAQKGPRWSGGSAWIEYTAISIVFSHAAGLYGAAFQLDLTTNAPGAVIRYTTDGRDPTAASPVCAGPIAIQNTSRVPVSGDLSRITNTVGDGNTCNIPTTVVDRGTVIKAQVWSDDGKPLSDVYTRSYFVGLSYPNLPVVSLVTDPDGFFDSRTGIYVNTRTSGNIENFWQRGADWERPVHVELFETDGSVAASQNMGVRINGNWSRYFAQKSLRLYAKSGYDAAHPLLDCDIFQNWAKTVDGEDITSFKRLVLRQSGDDNTTNRHGTRSTMFRDMLFQRLMHDTKDGTQAGRQSVVFLDGEFWGIYNIRERYDQYYYQSHYNLPDAGNIGELNFGANCNNVPEEIQETPDDPDIQSDYASYMVMYNWFNTHRDLSAPADYAKALTFLDADNVIDNYISHIYSVCQDWPGNNIVLWRYRTDGFPAEGSAPAYDDGRWYWATKDLDGEEDGRLNYDEEMFTWIWNQQGNAVFPRTPDWSVRIYKALLTNPTFRDQFVTRFCDLLNTNLKPEVVRAAVDELAGNIEPTIQKHLERWISQNSSYNRTKAQWLGYVEGLRTFADNRPAYIRTHMKNATGNYLGVAGASEAALRTTVNDAAMGYVRVNTIDILPSTPGVTNPADWSGLYFTGKEQTITAVPDKGYYFEGFFVDDQFYSQNPLRLTLTADTTVQAVFTVDMPAYFPVTVQVKSYNPGVAATIELMQGGLVFETATIPATGGQGLITQDFTFGALQGEYTMIITKPGHTSFTVQKITVGDSDLDLTKDPRPEVQCITLLCGDINGDNMINDGDLAILWLASNYNKNANAPDVNSLCDLNGDGMINDGDLAILWLAVNYNKGAVVVN